MTESSTLPRLTRLRASLAPALVLCAALLLGGCGASGRDDEAGDGEPTGASSSQSQDTETARPDDTEGDTDEGDGDDAGNEGDLTGADIPADLAPGDEVAEADMASWLETSTTMPAALLVTTTSEDHGDGWTMATQLDQRESSPTAVAAYDRGSGPSEIRVVDDTLYQAGADGSWTSAPTDSALGSSLYAQVNPLPRFAEWSAGGAQVLYLGEEDGERRFTVTEPGTPLAEASRNVEREGVLITFDDRGLLTLFRTSWSARMYDEFALDWSASIEPATVPEGDISPMPGT